ncbi:hypothetical protein D3C78_1045560 [compost metagenome]
MQAASFLGFGHHLTQFFSRSFGGLLHRVEFGGVEILGRNDESAARTEQHHVACHDRVEGNLQVVGLVQRLTDHRFRPFDPRGRGFTEEGRAKHHDTAVGHFQFSRGICRLW